MTKKNIFYTVALLLAGTMITACSGGDDVTNDVTPVSQPVAEAGDVVELSGTLGSKSDVTRAIDAEGNGSWEVGDQFAVYYETTNGNASTVARVNSVNGDGSANFTAVLHNPKGGDNSVKLVSPASAHDGEGGFKTDALMNQGGTLEYINKHGLDIETATATMSVEGMTAKLTEEVTMEPQVCLYTMNLYKDRYNNSLSATKLEIIDITGNHCYTITPTSATSSFTVALLPASWNKFTFSATSTDEKSIFTKQDDVTLANCTANNVGDVFDKDGNIYKVSKVIGVIYTEDFTRIQLNKGKFYSQNELVLSTAIIDPSPAVAMIAYVGENGSVETGSNYRGLAIAMRDSNKENTKNPNENWWESTGWSTQRNPWSSVGNTGPCTSSVSDDVTVARGLKNGISMTDELASDNHTTTTGHTHWAARVARNYNVTRPDDTSDWFLASLGQWQLILQGLITKQDNLTEFYSGEIPCGDNEAGNPDMTYSHLGPILSKAGVSLGPCYWSSSEYSVSDAWTVGLAADDGAAFVISKTYGSFHIHPVLAF